MKKWLLSKEELAAWKNRLPAVVRRSNAFKFFSAWSLEELKSEARLTELAREAAGLLKEYSEQLPKEVREKVTYFSKK